MNWLERFRAWFRARREFNHQRWCRRNGVIYTTTANGRQLPDARCDRFAPWDAHAQKGRH